MNPQVNSINKIIKRLNQSNIKEKETIIIFPYGIYGKMVDGILKNYFHITPTVIIDNGLADSDNNIQRIDVLRNKALSDGYVLFCCNNPSLYETLKAMLLQYVDKNNILEIFQQRKGFRMNKMLNSLNDEYNARILQRHHRIHFLHTLNRNKKIKLLDVGCGNNSAELIKGIRPNIYYTGIDIGDYNQTKQSLGMIDDYHVVEPERFSDEMESLENTQDVVISNHNIEHTNEPEKCLIAMAKSLKKGGRIYMAFPSEKSVLFPHRGGTLNFYDDATHVNVMDFKKTCEILKENGIKITFATPGMRGWYLKRIGEYNEGLSIAMDKVLLGTWDYWGFEAIIWGKKK